jgi:hypothetical protein
VKFQIVPEQRQSALGRFALATLDGLVHLPLVRATLAHALAGVCGEFDPVLKGIGWRHVRLNSRWP